MFVRAYLCLYAYFHFKSMNKSNVRITHFSKIICYISIIFQFIAEVTLSEYQSLSLSVWPSNDVNVCCG